MIKSFFSKVLLLVLSIVASVNLSSCSDDSDYAFDAYESGYRPYNAIGVAICFEPDIYSDGKDNNDYYENNDKLHYWINSSLLLGLDYDEYKNIINLEPETAYRDFSTSLFYEYLNDRFHDYDYLQKYNDIIITENYDLRTLPFGVVEAIAAVKFINKYKYQYKYAAISPYSNGMFCLFNRTSDVNY